jgi:NADPH:quinone reductase-like Zn-dependent oxidoreductase
MAYARKDVIKGGTFAEYVSVTAASVAYRPAALTWEQAGGLPLTGLTALRSLDWLRVGPNDTLLIHGASGGVGLNAVQIGRDRGARVIGSASERNHDFLRSLGAEPVTYGAGLAERVRMLAPGGVSRVADFVGGQLETTLAVLAEGGRHVSVADNTVDDHDGHWIWVRPDGVKLAELAAQADRGTLKVELAAAYSMEAVGAAFDASRTGHTRGKLVIIP